WDVPLYVFRGDCLAMAKEKKTSVETTAREFRYACFENLLKEGKADFIATAHHVLDQAETVLFRLARGTSLSGVAGIHERREGYVRPFLDWTKEEIEAYVIENKLAYQTDKSNFEREYTRNKLRLDIIPQLEESVPGAVENIARFATLASEDDEYLYAQSEKLLCERDGRWVVAFCKEKPLFRRACLLAMKRLGVERDYTQTHLQDAYVLQTSEKGACLTLPKGVRAEKVDLGIAFFLEKDVPTYALAEEKAFSLDGFDGGMYEVKISKEKPKEKGYVGKALLLDLDKLPQEAIFRFRKDGDVFCKFGGAKKTLKKYYNEGKIPVNERACLPIVAGKDGNVYAVCGYEIAEGIKVTEDTKNQAYMTLWKKKGNG
ncbi:MAG: tRNA lysidine(34) synthetase TilS, partial [Clostridiales bacterium]|nr:tRNA lysidine(34) synthetase TilS [Clostridiales bacterium]